VQKERRNKKDWTTYFREIGRSHKSNLDTEGC